MKKDFIIKLTTKQVNTVLDILEKDYPLAGCALKYQTKFQLLIAVTLSAQTTDLSVNNVTPNLWKAYPDSISLARANQEDVESIIKSIGLYRNKSKNIIGIAKALQQRLSVIDDAERNRYLHSHDNKDGVPDTFEELIKLPGVGRKTANVVLAEAFGEQKIAVDTHVLRVSNRIGLASAKDTYGTEMDLMKAIPKSRWTKAHHLLIWHGRNFCKARNPDCDLCSVRDYCNYHTEISD